MKLRLKNFFRKSHETGEEQWSGWRIVISIIFVAGFLMLFVVGFNRLYDVFSMEATQDFLSRIGWAGTIVYIMFFVIGSFFFVSSTALSVIAPVIFGPWIGFVAMLAGNMAAAALVFPAIRWAGNRWHWVKRLRNHLPDGIIRFSHGNGLLITFYARFISLPASFVIYAAAILPISFSEHFLGTLFGILPHCLSTALLIGILRDALIAGDWSSVIRWETVLLAATYLVTFIAVYHVRKRMSLKRSFYDEAAAGELG